MADPNHYVIPATAGILQCITFVRVVAVGIGTVRIAIVKI